MAQYSDFSWHPEIKSSKNVGSSQMEATRWLGQPVRAMTNNGGKELVETVTEWDEKKKYFAMSIDEGGPSFAKKLIIAFRVREEAGSKVFVDAIVDVDLKLPFIILTPLMYVALPKQLTWALVGWDCWPETSVEFRRGDAVVRPWRELRASGVCKAQVIVNI